MQSDPVPQQPTTPIPFQLFINTQYIKDLSFENPHAPNSFLLQGTPKVAVNIQVQARPLNEQAWESVLTIRAEGKLEETSAFIVELTYGGICTIQAKLPPEAARPILLVEAPKLMFPFARLIIADAVRNGGYGPLLLNPVDFAEMYRRQSLSEQAQLQDNGSITMPRNTAGTA